MYDRCCRASLSDALDSRAFKQSAVFRQREPLGSLSFLTAKVIAETQYGYSMASEESENLYEFISRRLEKLQSDARTLRVEVDRFSSKAKSAILEDTSH